MERFNQMTNATIAVILKVVTMRIARMPHSLADKRINRGARGGRVTELTFTIEIKMSVVIRRGRRHQMMLICGTTINTMKTFIVDHLKSNRSQNVVPKEQIASLLADLTVNNSVESLEQSRKKKMKTIWR